MAKKDKFAELAKKYKLKDLSIRLERVKLPKHLLKTRASKKLKAKATKQKSSLLKKKKAKKAMRIPLHEEKFNAVPWLPRRLQPIPVASPQQPSRSLKPAGAIFVCLTCGDFISDDIANVNWFGSEHMCEDDSQKNQNLANCISLIADAIRGKGDPSSIPAVASTLVVTSTSAQVKSKPPAVSTAPTAPSLVPPPPPPPAAASQLATPLKPAGFLAELKLAVKKHRVD